MWTKVKWAICNLGIGYLGIRYFPSSEIPLNFNPFDQKHLTNVSNLIPME